MRLLSALLLVTSLAIADAAHCDKALIQGVTDTEIKRDPSKNLKCNDPTPKIEYAGKLYDEIQCTSSKKWINKKDGKPLVPEAKPGEKINIKCVAKACHASLVTITDKVTRTLNDLVCKDPVNEQLQINGAGRQYDDLSCTSTEWTTTSGQPVGKVAEKDFSVDCVARAPANCANPNLPGATLDATNTLTCTAGPSGSAPKALMDGPTLHASIVCNPIDGVWKDGSATITQIAALTCEEYCKVTGTGAEVSPTPADPSIFTVGCTNNAHTLMHEGAQVAAGKLTCTLAAGWVKEGGVAVPQPTNPLPVTCAAACANIKRDNGAGVEEPGLTDAAIRNTVGTSEVFKCKSVGYGEDKNGIKLNGALVHSHLYCDATGWHGVDQVAIVTDPFAAVTIECEKLKCSTPGSVCARLKNLNNPKAAEGFKCDDNIRKLESGDPNSLKCKPLHTMFDAGKSEIITKQPVCHDDAKWYTDGTEVDSSTFICLLKRCNMCSEPNELAGSPSTLKSVFTPGTTDACALAKCPKDLWSIKTDGATAAVQYSGEIVCSSVEATEGAWIIDDSTKVTEASCLPDPTDIDCVTAAKLDVECLPAYPAEAGCVPITLTNDPTQCVSPKQMFYKQKGAKHFEEGAFKISCDKTAGIWKITKEDGLDDDVLKRGGSIVCADKNPAAAPTPPACEKCKAIILDTLNKCSTCSQKESDLQFVDNETKDICIVTSYVNGKIETEKSGTVDKIFCNKTDPKWRDEKGNEVGKFAANNGTKKDENDDHMIAIIGGVVGTALVLIVVFVIIFKVFVAKKKPVDEKEEETKRKMLEESRKKKKKKAGDNDEILDEIAVDAPSEIKL